METNRIYNFKSELKELLKKYNAEISAEMDGDTHGASVMVIIDIDNNEVIRINDCISHYDIKIGQ